ncbi:MAG TPA: hypothetical protein PLO53_04800 [Candidatus Hydrogenedentes bacterium]|nr:hypothetical protein [Candidatus Hydrogenedentota bacterium]HPU97260.1 hypothetical protein [Candidatus Hydrogenedentota bacterium]
MNKDITLAGLVPGAWLTGLLGLVVGALAFVLYTVASPVLFLIALFRPEGVDDILALITGEGDESE